MITSECRFDRDRYRFLHNDTDLRELRQTILEEIEDMDLELLKRIAYECRCEENGIYPDQTYIRW